MRVLTNAESEMINNTAYTVDWSNLIEADNEYSGEQWDLERELEIRFEQMIHNLWHTRDDIGGLTVYFRDDKLVAFYDYEQYVGTIF